MLIHQPGKRRMPLNALTDYIDSKEKEMIELLEKMVNIDCGTYCKEGVNQVGDLLADRLSTLGFSTERKSQEEYVITSLGTNPDPAVIEFCLSVIWIPYFPRARLKIDVRVPDDAAAERTVIGSL